VATSVIAGTALSWVEPHLDSNFESSPQLIAHFFLLCYDIPLDFNKQNKA
jgi:hypothetical protein